MTPHSKQPSTGPGGLSELPATFVKADAQLATLVLSRMAKDTHGRARPSRPRWPRNIHEAPIGDS